MILGVSPACAIGADFIADSATVSLLPATSCCLLLLLPWWLLQLHTCCG